MTINTRALMNTPTAFGALVERLMAEHTRDGTSRRQVAAAIGMNLGSIDAVIAATKPGQVMPVTIAGLSRLGMTPAALCRVIFEHDLGVPFDGGALPGAPPITPDELSLLRSATTEEIQILLGMLRQIRAGQSAD